MGSDNSLLYQYMDVRPAFANPLKKYIQVCLATILYADQALRNLVTFSIRRDPLSHLEVGGAPHKLAGGDHVP